MQQIELKPNISIDDLRALVDQGVANPNVGRPYIEWYTNGTRKSRINFEKLTIIMRAPNFDVNYVFRNMTPLHDILDVYGMSFQHRGADDDHLDAPEFRVDCITAMQILIDAGANIHQSCDSVASFTELRRRHVPLRSIPLPNKQFAINPGEVIALLDDCPIRLSPMYYNIALTMMMSEFRDVLCHDAFLGVVNFCSDDPNQICRYLGRDQCRKYPFILFICGTDDHIYSILYNRRKRLFEVMETSGVDHEKKNMDVVVRTCHQYADSYVKLPSIYVVNQELRSGVCQTLQYFLVTLRLYYPDYDMVSALHLRSTDILEWLSDILTGTGRNEYFFDMTLYDYILRLAAFALYKFNFVILPTMRTIEFMETHFPLQTAHAKQLADKVTYRPPENMQDELDDETDADVDEAMMSRTQDEIYELALQDIRTDDAPSLQRTLRYLDSREGLIKAAYDTRATMCYTLLTATNLD